MTFAIFIKDRPWSNRSSRSVKMIEKIELLSSIFKKDREDRIALKETSNSLEESIFFVCFWQFFCLLYRLWHYPLQIFLLKTLHGALCTVGWSDLALFLLMKTYTFLPIRHIFRNSIPKNRQFQPRPRGWHERQSLNFQKIIGALKIYIFIWNFAQTFLIHQKTIYKNKIWKIFLFNIIFSYWKWSKLFLIWTRSK